ncbi:Linear gramicidin synthase subunit B [Aquisphaera giovannonii]|uniref:Linear gramicidin synthase subunit B n=1 Tax=Aquisphaera giovannonii TaxID=406548 RepID=A0A5B9W3S0_9BACT|nr:non-ribosomal peptide synthetase [Aquisphaera giovannonii]QEH34735.1 Linear gramicidin synthase subunit B [Aquisphaera giovannonii]
MSRMPGVAGLTVEQKRALAARLLREKAAARPASPPLLPALFEERAAGTPQALAVSDGSEALTYAELDRRAGRLAARLRAMGAGPETLVGVHLGRSCSTLAALIAVHKAGAAYLPLDPAFPEARLRHMVEDSGTRILLTERATRGGIPGPGLERLCLDDGDTAGGAGNDERRPHAPIDARNLAYVLYTSGSTGRPKGVQVTHGALANFLTSMRSIVGMNARDAILAVTTLSFDIAALELFLPLICGARVDIADRETAADGARLARRLDDPAITFLQATPATWRALLDAGWRGKRGLTMLCGGEALPRSLADRLLDKGEALWNVYGPTETTIWSSAWRVEPGEVPIVIGHPLANTQLLVLDHRLRPAPVGVTGELYIGGDGLARGYRSRPGLTAERFLPDPTGSSPGARIYRTGDLARRRADGAIECLGRADHQVKVRGYRIELGEVEAALAKHEGLRDAAVIARPDASGEASLAAFVVPRGEAPAPSALRDRLLEQLPEYMIPSTFTALDALPLTPNGKVDRKALAESGPASAPAGTPQRPPRGAMEESLADLWADLFGVPRVGVLDNFFELGGHSLLVIQLLGRLRQTFGVEVPLRAFVDDPTVAGLSRLVESALAGGTVADASPIERLPRDGSPLPASFAQQRLWYLDQLQPGDASYNIPMAVRLEGALDVPALSKALAEIVRRHETLRTTFAAIEGVPHQQIAEAAELPLEVEPLDGADEAALRERLRELGTRPFDLAGGPVLRARLLRLGEGDHVLSLVVHHIAADGWSMGVLIGEATALYEAFRRGGPSPLPELAIQYADFAAWQRRALSGDALDSHLAFWRERLAGLRPAGLPADHPEPAGPANRAGEARGKVAGDVLGGLKRLAREGGATLYMALLAALDALLARYTGSDDVAVGTPVAGRSRPEAEGLVGFFVNTLVVRSDLSGSPGFRRLLARVRRDALDAYAHQDLPFERLVGELRETPFRVMFVLQNAPLPPLEAEGLRLSAIDVPSSVAKFDATLFAMEHDGGLELTLEYRAERYEAATMERLLAGYRRLLEEIVAGPDRPIAELPIVSHDERMRMLGEWNRPAGDDLGIGS